jgi:hypothetical protein
MKQKIEKMEELSKRIYSFLDKYAGIRPDFNPYIDEDYEKYTSPDASQMRYAADMFKINKVPSRCWSE